MADKNQKYIGKENYLRKVIDYHQNSDTLLDFLDNRIALHNALFPESSYVLTGFTKIGRFFSPVVEQRFIKGRGYNKDDNFPQYMFDTFGFEQFSYSDTSYYNDFYIVEDLHEQNVFKVEDGFIFIDTIPSLRDKNRYRDFQIMNF